MGQSWRRSISGSLAAAAGVAAVLAADPARSASQGSLGAISHGSVTIRLSIRTPAASGLSDFAFDSGATAPQDVCLRGAPRTAYRLLARGSGSDGALSLSNGERTIPYRVEWHSHAATAELSADTSLTIPAVAQREDCGRAPGSGRLAIALAAADLERLQAGAPYAGALVLLLVPE